MPSLAQVRCPTEPTVWEVVPINGWDIRQYATAVQLAFTPGTNLLLVLSEPPHTAPETVTPWDTQKRRYSAAKWFVHHLRDSDRASMVWDVRKDIDTVHPNEVKARLVKDITTAMSILEMRIPQTEGNEHEDDLDAMGYRESQCCLWGDEANFFWNNVLCNCGDCEQCDRDFIIIDDTPDWDTGVTQRAKDWLRTTVSPGDMSP